MIEQQIGSVMSKKLNIQDMQTIAASRGGECLSEIYENSKSKLLWRCREGHIWESTPNNISRGSWCANCRIFLREEICRTTFEQLFNEKFHKTRPIWLKNSDNNQMELDGYSEKLGIAFEYQGEQHFKKGFYTSSDKKLTKRKQDDLLKKHKCYFEGVKLVQIFYWDEPATYPALIEERLALLGFDVKKWNFKKRIDFDLVYEHKSKISQMKQLAKRKGGYCLSNKFVTLGHPLKWQCSKGHTWHSTGSRVKRGDWCSVCAGRARLSIELVNEIAKQRGGVCLSTEYRNNKTKLLFKCKFGHEWEAIPNTIISRGSWCPHCAPTAKGSIDEMREIAKSRGGNCLSVEYANSSTPLTWQCNNGHEWSAASRDVKSGTWCPRCAGNVSRNIQEMQEFARSKGGKCLSRQYTNTLTPLLWQCEFGHKWRAAPNSLKSRNTWCPTCAGNARGSLQEMQEIAISKGGRCLSNKYENNSSKLEWKCSSGHRWFATPRDIKFGSRNRKTGQRKGTWCPVCANTVRVSKLQKFSSAKSE